MSYPLVAASIGAFVLGLVHSVLGEVLLMRHLGGVHGVPILFGSDTFGKQTLRGTWHVTTLFAWALAAYLARLAVSPAIDAGDRFFLSTLTVTFGASGLLMLVATRGKHASWVAFFALAALTWVGQ